MREIIDSASYLLEQGESFALATVITKTGSSPRKAGTQMLISQSGQITGTIGGGSLEARVQKDARKVIINKQSAVMDFDLSGQDSAELGMVCGGQAKVLISYVNAEEKNNRLIFTEAVRLREGKGAWLLTFIPTGEKRSSDQCLIKTDGSIIGEIPPLPNHLKDIVNKVKDFEILNFDTGEQVLIQKIFNRDKVYIFGAGHISHKLVPLLAMVGFETTVLDDRIDFANQERFPDAAQVFVLESFEKALTYLNKEEEGYIVIVTRGHLHDKTVLAQALRTKSKYIGMIGSRSKRDKIYEALYSEGFTQEDLKRVYSPIGLAIGADSPEEIAISIVAEMIKVRAENAGNK